MAKKEKIARQDTLPTMEDTKIKDIEEAALNYAEGRDARMEATVQEVALKTSLIDAMHKHSKQTYKRGNISVVLTVEKEKVKVRIKDDVVVETGKQAEVA